jgi:hypothetical protein
MINKELLSEVLGSELEKLDDYDGRITDLYTEKNFIQISYIEKGYSECMINCYNFNIYELAHKCKEWACCRWSEDDGVFYLNNFDSSRLNHCKMKYQSCVSFWTPETGDMSKCFHADTEPEAVFKACEYIMENKNDNK